VIIFGINKRTEFTVATHRINDPYFTPDSQPFQIDQDNTFSYTMSASNSAGKQPMPNAPISNVNGSGRHGGTNIVSVEPPKQSDLQVYHQFIGACN
jgi:hypothetical protein